MSLTANSNSSSSAVATAELTCISEEVMMENILDNLIWDTTTMDEDFIQNGLEGHSHRDQERPRMLREFENNLKGLLTKDVSCGSKSADLYQIPAEAVIEKKKRQLVSQHRHHSNHGNNSCSHHSSLSSNKSSLPPPLPCSSPPVSTTDSNSLNNTKVGVNGDTPLTTESTVVKKDSCTHNKLESNKSSDKQCLQSKRGGQTKKNHDMDDFDDIRRTSSTSINNEEDEEMLRNTRLVISDDEDDDRDNEDKGRQLTKNKDIHKSNDSFPDDESEGDRLEVEAEDEEVLEKSFEQEDTIVCFHRQNALLS